MQVVKTVAEVRSVVSAQRKQGRAVGLVPTMGALHEGHLSLVDIVKQHCDYTILYIFLNPLQFDDSSDLKKYPQTLEQDCLKAKARGVDLVFAPNVAEIYPKLSLGKEEPYFATRVVAGSMGCGLCGESRPGFFDGIVTVLSAFFNIIEPDVAIFGEKDFQQLKVIKQLVSDLHINVEIISGPLVRDKDGLALNSRNVLLSAQQREHALVLHRALFSAKEEAKNGKTLVSELRKMVIEILQQSNEITVDYVEIVDEESLEPLEEINKSARLLAAIKVGSVRLIDNIELVVS